MIQLQQATVRYGTITALPETDLTIDAGEFVLVTGPSGCGKTTLARLIAGLIPQALPATFEGRVMVDGLDTRSHPLATLARHVGMVFQNPATQLFHLSVEDEVAFGPRNLALDESEVSQRVEWALAATGLTQLRRHSPARLSGGQQQRVAIAAALALRPPVLVLDEPTASLDVPGTKQLMSTLAELHQRHGVTIIIVEHRLAEVARLANRVILLEEGKIVADGAPEQVLSERPLLRRLGIRRPTDESPQAWEHLLRSNGSQPSPARPLLELQDAYAGYRNHPVLNGINLSLYPSEFAAVVGDNGAGKSTLGLVAAGLLKPKQGKVLFAGGKRLRLGLDVGLLFQNPLQQLFTDSVDEEVAFGPRNYDRFDSAFHKQVLIQADLTHLRRRLPLALSLGQQQRTTLASTLSLRPRLIILDEPTVGQDWGHLQQLMDFLLTLNQQGTAILLITHDYKLVHHYARRVLLLRDGRIVSLKHKEITS
jgi:energy-coupling factor transport system ATP-binding protein